MRPKQFDCQTGGAGLGSVGGGGTSICLKFLAGACNEPGCNQKHLHDPAECQRWILYFGGQPCKNGDDCRVAHCLYFHKKSPMESAPAKTMRLSTPMRGG